MEAPEHREAAGAELPTLGVAIPTLEEERRIGALVARLLAAPEAEDRADHVVVADGGSADRTREIASSLGARVVVAPRGRGTQLRAAGAALDDDVLLFLHADCTPEPGALARVRAAFLDPSLSAGAMRQSIDARGAFYRAVERAADLRVAWLGIVYGDSALALRRDEYAGVGGYPPIALMEDVELSLRLRRRTRPRLIDGAGVRVSARRWQREGALRATLRNWMLVALFALGARPAQLARLYPPEPGRPS